MIHTLAGAALFIFGAFLIIRFAVLPLADAISAATTRVRRVSEVTSGAVALQGSAGGQNSSLAPFSGRTCLMATAEVYLERIEKRGGDWTIVGTLTFPDAPRFTLKDASGAIEIHGEGAEVVGDGEEILSFDAQTRSLVESLRPRLPPLGPGARVVERTVVAGNDLYVLGTGGPARGRRAVSRRCERQPVRSVAQRARLRGR